MKDDGDFKEKMVIYGVKWEFKKKDGDLWKWW